MDKTIEGYLARLRSALAGADPALVQDALYDAEEYLRDAIAETGGDPVAAFDAAVEAYGSPEEVAGAYRDAELTVHAALRTPTPAVASSDNVLARFFGVVADPRAWGSLFYMLLAFITGIVYFTVVVTGVSVTLGTLVLIIGLPIALLTLAVVRAMSFVEGRMVEALLGVRMPRRPRIAPGTSDTGFLARIKSWLTDWRTWTSMLYMMLQLALGTTYFALLVTAVSVSLALIAAPVLQFTTDGVLFQTSRYAYSIEMWSMPLFIIVGLLGLVCTLWMAKGIGYLHGLYAKALLVGKIDAAAEPVSVVHAQPVSSAAAPGVDTPAVVPQAPVDDR